MNQNYLELLEQIRDVLTEIQSLQEDLGDLLDNPGVTLENLGQIRDALSEIQSLQEGLEE